MSGGAAKKLEVWSKIAALMSFSAGVFFYIHDRVTSLELEIARPSVIEFRCQSLTFAFEDCFHKNKRKFRNLSMSAALQLNVKGPAIQSLSINDITAKVTFPWGKDGQLASDANPRQTIVLSAFWTGDLTGGKADFKQAVTESIAGGTSMQREYWMMPRPGKECFAGSGGGAAACLTERSNFIPWFKFVSNAYNEALKAPLQEAPRIDIRIEIKTTPSTQWGSKPEVIHCSVYLGRSAVVGLAKHGEKEFERGKPGWLTLPCRKPPK